MAGRGPQSFKKRQKEQQRKERQQEKAQKREERKGQPKEEQELHVLTGPQLPPEFLDDLGVVGEQEEELADAKSER